MKQLSGRIFGSWVDKQKAMTAKPLSTIREGFLGTKKG